MALQDLTGSGLFLPSIPQGFGGQTFSGLVGTLTLDADEEEVQHIGRIIIDGGGSKTFGTSGSKISWFTGSAITFQASATFRIGVKKASSISTTVGPPARATIGAAAFDVYKDLIGGTDTISVSTWRDETMASGTPFTVNHGDLIAICFHLDIVSAVQSILLRVMSAPTTVSLGQAAIVLVTSGPTYAAQTLLPNCLLTFDDGSLGWIYPTIPITVTGGAGTVTATIGNGNIYANIFQLSVPSKIDGLEATIATGGDCALELYSTPLGTPVLIESVPVDANIMTATQRNVFVPFTTSYTLLANTDYAIGIKQTTATAVTTLQHDVNHVDHFKPLSMGANCYAAISTAGGTFAVQNSGKRRYPIYARVSALDDGAGSGGGQNRAILPSGVSALG